MKVRHDNPLGIRSPVNRRGVLRAGILGFGGMSLSNLLRLRAAAGPSNAKDTAVIFLFLHGGPSQLETYDMKPLAPSDMRGPFRPIGTNVPGMNICEWLPQHARTAHRFTLIRSCTHDISGHFEAHGRFMSGNPGLKPGTFESTHPQMGAIVGRTLKTRSRGLPAAPGIGKVVYNSGFGEYVPGSVKAIPLPAGMIMPLISTSPPS